MLWLAAALLAGVGTGLLLHIDLSSADIYLRLALYALVFLIGLDLGSDWRTVVGHVRKQGLTMIMTPVLTVVGSLVGGVLAGLLCGMVWRTGMILAAGFGWYTLSAIIIGDALGPEMGTLSFLANIVRETLAICLIPFITRRIGGEAAIAAAGATAMDVTMPVITRSAGPQWAVPAFISGGILSLLVPVLVPALLSL
jgi:uncharacterized membrane protein YbjE (DUF340 family)